MSKAKKSRRVTIDFDGDLITEIDLRCERDIRSRSYIVNKMLKLVLKGAGKGK